MTLRDTTNTRQFVAKEEITKCQLFVLNISNKFTINLLS